MKIGLVCPYNMFQFWGGVQEIVVQLQSNLQAKGHKVVILTPRPRLHLDKAPKDMILIGRSAKVNTPFATMVDLSVEADGEEIDDIITREKFDILHFHEPWIPVLSRQILTRSDAVNIATFHGTLPETVISKSLMSAVTPYTKSVLNYLHVYTAVSASAAEYVKTMTDEAIEIVPNGIDLNIYKKPENVKKSNKKTIFYVGRLEKRKGVKYLVEAYAKLRENRQDVKLVIAGKGVKRKSLEKYVDMYEIPDVEFLGYITDEEKIRLLAGADVFCSPATYGESFGIVLLEAMALGIPTVAGNNQGYASVMTETGRISLVDPQSTDDFAMRLDLMLYDQNIRKIWQEWAKNRVKTYSFDKITNAYENVYKKAIKENVKV